MDLQASQRSSHRWEAACRALLWCLVALAAVLHVLQFAFLPSFLDEYGRRPVTLKVVDERGPLRYRVESIDSAALDPALDLKVGDILHRPVAAPREARSDQVAQYQLIRDGERRTIAIPYVPAPVSNDLVVHDIAWPIVQCLELALGVILLRNRRAGRPALALAAPLIMMGVPDLLVPIGRIPPDAIVPLKAAFLLTSLYPLGVPLFAVFAYEFARPQLSAVEKRYLRWAAWLLPLLSAGIFLLGFPYLFGFADPLADGLFAFAWGLVWCFVVGVLITGMRRTKGDLRERYGSVALSAGYLLAIYVGWNIYAWWLKLESGYTSAVVAVLMIFAGVVALTVSLLRHHVVELRVVVSRTLVFSIVSAVLVLAFALAEFASDKLLHFEGRETNILVDAGVALVLFITARRLHHGVERFVQRTLFRPWHLALEGLHDFARDAGFITNADVLRGRLLQALARFAGTETAARLFHRREDGRFIEWRNDSEPPEALDENDPWLVTMRSTLAPVQEAAKHPDMPAALAAPILRTGHVTGFILLGSKPDYQSYRSDEIAAIEDVLKKVALDLECLRAIEAEAQLRELRAEVQQGRRPIEPPRLAS